MAVGWGAEAGAQRPRRPFVTINLSNWWAPPHGTAQSWPNLPTASPFNLPGGSTVSRALRRGATADLATHSTARQTSPPRPRPAVERRPPDGTRRCGSLMPLDTDTGASIGSGAGRSMRMRPNSCSSADRENNLNRPLQQMGYDLRVVDDEPRSSSNSAASTGGARAACPYGAAGKRSSDAVRRPRALARR